MRKIINLKVPLYIALIIILGSASVIALALFWYGGFSSSKTVVLNSGQTQATEFQYGSWPALSRPDFFAQTEKSFIESKSDFIKVDLSAMKLSIYKNGNLEQTMPILTKGKEGSWWETPAGLYKIEGKERNHFSSIGRVYMPYSLPFQGNFFIHGWPYHPDGTAVASSFTGGCVRLATSDAKAVYDAVEVGTPVLVYEKDFEADAFKYQLKSPEISAAAYLAADLANNFIFLEKNSKDELPIASITKLMTGLVAAEYINLEKTATVSEDDLAPTSIPRLKTGEKISVYDLLYPLLLESSNEAALTLSNVLGRKRFVELMNQKTKALGMESTSFVDAAGREAGNISTAQDLFGLARYLLNNRSFILKLTAGRLSYSAYGSPKFKNLKNLNLFGDDPDFVGGKIGKSSAAEETILSIFQKEFNGEKRTIAVIVLGSTDVASDVQKILEYIQSLY